MWPKSQDKNWNFLRKKNTFMIKHETFFIIFQGLSIAQICLRPESVTLRKKMLLQLSRKTRFRRNHKGRGKCLSVFLGLTWRMVTYLEELLSIKSDEALIMRSCEINRETRTIISLLPKFLWPAKLTGCWLTLSCSHPWTYSSLWSGALARLRDKL